MNKLEHIQEMINSLDKESRYLAVSMLKYDKSNDIPFEQSIRLITKIPVTERIRNFGDICYELGENENDIIIFKDPTTLEQKYINACVKISRIAKVYNEDPKFPDLNRTDQNWYFPYFKKDKSSGWLVDGCGWGDRGGSYLPAGFYFKTDKLGMEAAKRFPDIYNDFLNYKL